MRQPNRAGRLEPPAQPGPLQHLEAERAEAFAAHLVARVTVLLDQRDAQTLPGQQKGGGASGGAGANDHHIDRHVHHPFVGHRQIIERPGRGGRMPPANPLR